MKQKSDITLAFTEKLNAAGFISHFILLKKERKSRIQQPHEYDVKPQTDH